ncbi:hypothetical protein K438DRAFT_1979473 [Mycena galopus ATCC 62051]|nr:hypothetical protein K438DRAFT_1979473 [Mycena galopus ATCC 62051]
MERDTARVVIVQPCRSFSGVSPAGDACLRLRKPGWALVGIRIRMSQRRVGYAYDVHVGAVPRGAATRCAFRPPADENADHNQDQDMPHCRLSKSYWLFFSRPPFCFRKVFCVARFSTDIGKALLPYVVSRRSTWLTFAEIRLTQWWFLRPPSALPPPSAPAFFLPFGGRKHTLSLIFPGPFLFLVHALSRLPAPATLHSPVVLASLLAGLLALRVSDARMHEPVSPHPHILRFTVVPHVPGPTR